MTPTGALVDIDGQVILASAALPPSEIVSRPVGVLFTEVVEESGAQLRRLAVPSGSDAAIMLEARGPIEAIVALLAEIETEHSAPLRLEGVRLRPVSDDGVAPGGRGRPFDMDVTFRLREPAPSTAGTAAS
jgi:hypothetical protein